MKVNKGKSAAGGSAFYSRLLNKLQQLLLYSMGFNKSHIVVILQSRLTFLPV